MTDQIPHGPAHLYCPDWKKPMSKVCHTCPLWVQMRGKNPNTGDDVDRWNCAKAFMPLLQVEIAKEVRQGAAATESFRNVISRIGRKQLEQRDQMMAMAKTKSLEAGQ